MQIKDNSSQISFAQSIRNDERSAGEKTKKLHSYLGANCPAGSPAQRGAGPNSHNRPSLTKDPLPAFTAMQDSKKTENICPTCGKNRRREAIPCGIKYSFHVMCECEKNREQAAKENLEKLDKMRKIEKLKSLSLLGERYKSVTFSNSKTSINSSFDTAFNRCKKYCEVYEKTVKNGCGIYLFGDKGVGKTHLTACMANFSTIKE